MVQLINSLTDGFLLGFVYGLAAMGLSLIWGVMTVINLAHGPVITVGMLATFAVNMIFLGVFNPVFGGDQNNVDYSLGSLSLGFVNITYSPLLALTLFESLVQLKGQGLTMLLVEQNVAMALGVSDYAYVLSQGRISLEGESRQLLKNDEIRRTYLGM